MKLRTFLASLVMLGLTGPALANGTSYGAPTPTAGTASQLNAMNAQVAKMEAVLDQNTSGILWKDPSQANDWFHRVVITGQIDVDASASNRTPGDNSTSSVFATNSGVSDIYVSDANLFVDAQPNNWTKGHLALAYEQDTPFQMLYASNHAITSLGIDEAIATIGNFAKSPVFFRAGRMYVPHSKYERHPIAHSLTTLLSETRTTAAQLGVVLANGFNGSVWLYGGSNRAGGNVHAEKFGVNGGYNGSYNNVAFNAVLSYLNDMNDINIIRNVNGGGGLKSTETKRIGSVAAGLDINSGPFDAHGRYVTALQNFAAADLPGAPRPWALDLNGGYSFQAIGHDARGGLGFQYSNNALILGLSKYRVQGDLNVNVWKNTDVAGQLRYDKDYKVTSGGTNLSAFTGTVRLAVGLA